jgi:dCMP deaminase
MKTLKRTDYISWDEYFMGVSALSAMRSKDPNTQVGACIVSDQNKILSMGYNGFPNGVSDDEFPWAREGEELETKYPYVTHAELNAILNYRGGSLEGTRQWSMRTINMTEPPAIRRPSGCSMRQGCGITSTSPPERP